MEERKQETIHKRKIDPNLIIALGVLIASFSALFVYIQQASIMREQTELLLEQTKANAWPYLTVNMSQSRLRSELQAYEIVLSNRGTGPAIIEGTVITYQEEPVRDWSNFYSLIETPDSIDIIHSNSNLYEYVILPGEEFRFIDWSLSKALMRYINDRADEITIKICYRSVYNDRWQVMRSGFRTGLEKTIRRKISECSIAEDSLFLQ